MSPTKALLLLCILSYTMHQVSCFKCHVCDSDADKDCGTKEAKECGTDEKTKLGDDEVNIDECWTIEAKKGEDNVIIRYCGASSVDDAAAKALDFGGFTNEKVDRCKIEECNLKKTASSGSQLSIGFLSTMGVFFPLLVGKP